MHSSVMSCASAVAVLVKVHSLRRSVSISQLLRWSQSSRPEVMRGIKASCLAHFNPCFLAALPPAKLMRGIKVSRLSHSVAIFCPPSLGRS